MGPQPYVVQPSLFKIKGIGGEYPPPAATSREITATSALASTLPAYHAYLVSSTYSEHTIKAFLGDIRLLQKFLGPDQEIGQVTTTDLNKWLTYLRQGRGRPCSPKSLSRRVTSLRNFFGWLHQSGIIPEDPAASVVYKRATSPLPEILYDDECDHLLAAASSDSRTYVLVLLLLETGVKREELLKIKLTHLDLSDRYRPELWIRGKRHKERKLRLPPEFTVALDTYLAEYQPQENLFECTDRNLTYILQSVAKRAGIKKRVSCQILRDTFAVREIRAGEKIEKAFEKLGLAPGSFNEEARKKYLKLASPAL
ncbi:MAG: tyrosine-type recombinase/integrase [Dehalococcoidia bacterium]